MTYLFSFSVVFGGIVASLKVLKKSFRADRLSLIIVRFPVRNIISLSSPLSPPMQVLTKNVQPSVRDALFAYMIEKSAVGLLYKDEKSVVLDLRKMRDSFGN